MSCEREGTRSARYADGRRSLYARSNNLRELGDGVDVAGEDGRELGEDRGSLWKKDSPNDGLLDTGVHLMNWRELAERIPCFPRRWQPHRVALLEEGRGTGGNFESLCV